MDEKKIHCLVEPSGFASDEFYCDNWAASLISKWCYCEYWSYYCDNKRMNHIEVKWFLTSLMLH